jgi:L-seryl-tRNA(Ser) seleniumtransferase
MSNAPLRDIPSVQKLLESPRLQPLLDRYTHRAVAARVRGYLQELRQQLRLQGNGHTVPPAEELAERFAQRIELDERPPLRPVINATGILLHTGLGRAPLADEALQALLSVARGYASVELDLHSGKRSQRVVTVEGLLRELCGAEAATVVNNNAAATLLTLAALAAGREVIVSRGQLIEIGGSFRLPEVMATSGARLREVGTTNKTRLDDYRRAISDQTAALLRVHTSNFRVVGFTAEVPLVELVQLGRQHGLPVIDDIGSGALLDFAALGFPDEPQAAASIRTGADLVLFSGDKLLGGPQCGIIIGRRDLVQRIARHPMMRAMRVDKLTLSALEATLRLYRDPQRAARSVPLLRLLRTELTELAARAQRLAVQVRGLAGIAKADAVQDVAYLGGGSVPTQQIPTWCVALKPSGSSVSALAAALRRGAPAVVGRVQNDRLLLDLRSVFPEQDNDLLAALAAALRHLAEAT